MLNLWRRHIRKCPHDSRESLKCQCPIWIDWRIQGQRIRKPLGLRDWQAAQRRARDMEAVGLTTADGEPITIAHATEGFENDAKTTITDSTLKQYKILLRRLNDFSKANGYLFLKQLGVVQVRDFRNGWATYSPRTAGKHIERLKRFFTWCVENQWLESSPASPLKSPKVGETDVVPFSEEEIEKILKACKAYGGPNRDKLIVLTNLMLTTGLAIGDATMLSKSRLINNKSGWVVELRRTKTKTAVACPIPSNLAKAFMSLEGDSPFWSGKSDLEHLTWNWRKIYKRVFKAAGVPGHPHQFRHTCAKRMLVAGLPVSHVASLLGNTETIVRKHYSKWIPERQQAFEKAIRAIWKA